MLDPTSEKFGEMDPDERAPGDRSPSRGMTTGKRRSSRREGTASSSASTCSEDSERVNDFLGNIACNIMYNNI